MDLLLSLLCGALGGLALGGIPPRRRLGESLAALVGLLGGWAGAKALDHLALGLAHSPAPGGGLDPTALTLQAVTTGAAGALLVAALGQMRRLRRR